MNPFWTAALLKNHILSPLDVHFAGLTNPAFRERK